MYEIYIYFAEAEVLFIEKTHKNDDENKVLIVAGGVFLKKDGRYNMDIESDVFTIKDVKKSDSGFYSCVYQYLNERIKITHTLDVYFEPSVRAKKKTENVLAGDVATLNCKASGNPEPTITWTKQDSKMPSGAHEEVGTSISFENADRHIGGSYVCSASNGIGNPATAERNIIVSYAPEIRTEEVNVMVLNFDLTNY